MYIVFPMTAPAAKICARVMITKKFPAAMFRPALAIAAAKTCIKSALTPVLIIPTATKTAILAAMLRRVPALKTKRRCTKNVKTVLTPARGIRFVLTARNAPKTNVREPFVPMPAKPTTKTTVRLLTPTVKISAIQ